MPQSVYIHVPFCKRKCNYCAFTSITDINSVAAYLEALKREIKTFYRGEALNTLYFGGGTPSLLSADQVQGLVDMFNTTEKTEITLEANPDSADEKFLNGIKNCGVNRLSIGIQSFDDKTLRTIGRLHDSKQAMNAVETAKNEGFTNISTDFIYGLPSQQLEGFISDLKKAVEVCRYFGLTPRKAEEQALHISAFCSQNWEKVAREFQADPLEIDNMRKAFEQLDF